MDSFEGVPGGHYARTVVGVEIGGGVEIEAVAYVAGTLFIDESLRPHPQYLQTILRGAREHSLPEDYIRQIESLGNPGR